MKIYCIFLNVFVQLTTDTACKYFEDRQPAGLFAR